MASSPPWCIAFEPHHDDAHVVFVVARELLAGELFHIDLRILGKQRARGEEQGGGENRRVKGLHLSFLLRGSAAAGATLAVLLDASKKSGSGRFTASLTVALLGGAIERIA
jgi:hypothetical protein